MIRTPTLVALCLSAAWSSTVEYARYSLFRVIYSPSPHAHVEIAVPGDSTLVVDSLVKSRIHAHAVAADSALDSTRRLRWTVPTALGIPRLCLAGPDTAACLLPQQADTVETGCAGCGFSSDMDVHRTVVQAVWDSGAAQASLKAELDGDDSAWGVWVVPSSLSREGSHSAADGASLLPGHFPAWLWDTPWTLRDSAVLRHLDMVAHSRWPGRARDSLFTGSQYATWKFAIDTTLGKGSSWDDGDTAEASMWFCIPQWTSPDSGTWLLAGDRAWKVVRDSVHLDTVLSIQETVYASSYSTHYDTLVLRLSVALSDLQSFLERPVGLAAVAPRGATGPLARRGDFAVLEGEGPGRLERLDASGRILTAREGSGPLSLEIPPGGASLVRWRRGGISGSGVLVRP